MELRVVRANLVGQPTKQMKLSSEPSTPTKRGSAPKTKAPEAQKEQKKALSTKRKKEKAEETPMFSATQHTKRGDPTLKVQRTQAHSQGKEESADRLEEDTLDNVDEIMPDYCAENESHFGEKSREVKMLMEQRVKHFGRL